jgi:hypothetical protein
MASDFVPVHIVERRGEEIREYIGMMTEPLGCSVFVFALESLGERTSDGICVAV